MKRPQFNIRPLATRVDFSLRVARGLGGIALAAVLLCAVVGFCVLAIGGTIVIIKLLQLCRL